MNRYLASALLLLWACSPNEPVEPEKPDPTPGKTTTELTLSAAPFCGDWTKGDAVSVLDGNGNHRYTARETDVRSNSRGTPPWTERISSS